MIWGEHSQLRLQEHLYAQQLHSYVLSYCMSSFVLFLSTIFSPFSFCLQKPHPSQRAYLCCRLLSVISWFTNWCFYRSCRGGLEGFGSPSPLAIFYTVIIRSNGAASHRTSLTSAVKWQEKEDSQLNPMCLAEYVLKNFLSDLLNSSNELTPVLWIHYRFQEITLF